MGKLQYFGLVGAEPFLVSVFRRSDEYELVLDRRLSAVAWRLQDV